MKIPFKNEGEIRTFSDIQKLKEFITSRPPLLEMFKPFQQKENDTKWKLEYTQRREGVNVKHVTLIPNLFKTKTV